MLEGQGLRQRHCVWPNRQLYFSLYSTQERELCPCWYKGFAARLDYPSQEHKGHCNTAEHRDWPSILSELWRYESKRISMTQNTNFFKQDQA